MKIGMTGAAGTGRTTIAQNISKKLGIPFISSHSITRPILERDKYNYSMGYVEYFLGPREKELIESRIEEENKFKSFVTDRTVMDQFAYLMLSLQHYSIEDVKKIEIMCKQHMKTYTNVFYFSRPKTININGVRTANLQFQTTVDYVVRGLIDDWNIEVKRCKDYSRILNYIDS